MFYYVDNGKNGNNFKVHLSNIKSYIDGNVPIWSKDIISYKTGYIEGDLISKNIYYAVVEKFGYNEFNVIKVLNSRSEARSFLMKKKRGMHNKDYSCNVILTTRNCFEFEVKVNKDNLEDHNYKYRYDGGDYVVTDNGKIVARLDNPAEAREWIREAEEELLRNAD